MNRKPSQEENKLLLLFLLQEIGDMTASQIIRFCMEYELLEYLDLQLSLAELAEGGLLGIKRADIASYTITEDGKASLALFLSRLPYSRRAFIKEKAKIWRDTIREEQQIRTEVWPDAKGGAVAEMLVAEGDDLLFSVRLALPSVKDARQACARFREHSGDVYRALLTELYKEDENEP